METSDYVRLAIEQQQLWALSNARWLASSRLEHARRQMIDMQTAKEAALANATTTGMGYQWADLLIERYRELAFEYDTALTQHDIDITAIRHAEQGTEECIYCGSVVPEEMAPGVDEDAEWERIQSYHYGGCEWATTRALRI